MDKISQQYSEELELLNEKYTDLSKSYGESLTKLNELDSQYSELLKQYDTVLSENTRLTKLLKDMGETTIPDKTDDLNQRTSKFLSNLTPVSGTMDRDEYGLWDVAASDNYGNKYTSGIYMHQDYSNKFRLVYALDSKYSKLTGKFVLSEVDKNTDGHYTLYAYSLVDGNLSLLYESEVLATATRPIDVEIDVTGVMDLVIEMYDPNKSGNNAWTAFVDATLE